MSKETHNGTVSASIVGPSKQAVARSSRVARSKSNVTAALVSADSGAVCFQLNCNEFVAIAHLFLLR
jgi:hypothetical protein